MRHYSNEGPSTSPRVHFSPLTLNKRSRCIAVPQCDYSQQVDIADPGLQMSDNGRIDNSVTSAFSPTLTVLKKRRLTRPRLAGGAL